MGDVQVSVTPLFLCCSSEFLTGSLSDVGSSCLLSPSFTLLLNGSINLVLPLPKEDSCGSVVNVGYDPGKHSKVAEE